MFGGSWSKAPPDDKGRGKLPCRLVNSATPPVATKVESSAFVKNPRFWVSIADPHLHGTAQVIDD